MSTEITADERHVMEHATAWRSATPLYRNHFVTGPNCDNWATIQELCRRGLMRVSREPSELSGGDHVFSVTDAGLAALSDLDRVELTAKQREALIKAHESGLSGWSRR